MLARLLVLTWTITLCPFLSAETVGIPHNQAEPVAWVEDSRGSSLFVEEADPDTSLHAEASCTVTRWGRLEGESDAYPALASSKPWEGGKIAALISTSNMCVMLATSTGRGWALALQPNGSWLWNMGNGGDRAEARPSIENLPGAFEGAQYQTATLSYDTVFAIYKPASPTRPVTARFSSS